jgi:hypothetical protein
MKENRKMEKRSSGRQYCEIDIIWKHFNACFCNNQYCNAKTRNYSQNGVYFESNVSLKPKTCIHVRREGVSSLSLERFPLNNFRTTVVGEVKWCKKIPDGGSYKYGIGMKYYDPFF